MKLILVRHGETDWNRIRRMQGQTDIDLNDLGREQARLVGKALAGRDDFSAIYASDLKRAWHTAEAIAAHHPNLRLVADERLREISFGTWEGRIVSELAEDEMALLRRWRQNATEVELPGAEPMPAIAARLGSFVDSLRQTHQPDESLCIVAHGGSIRTLVCVVMGFDIKNVWRMGTENTAITELELYPDGPYLRYFNDSSHLEN